MKLSAILECLAIGVCPADAVLGCVCRSRPEGDKICVLSCATDNDCPKPPGQTLVCNADKICAPQTSVL